MENSIIETNLKMIKQELIDNGKKDFIENEKYVASDKKLDDQNIE